MDGVFINLTNLDIELKLEDKKYIIPANPELVTPTKDVVYTENNITAILSTPLSEEDIRYLHGKNWINTLYNKITRSEIEIKIPSVYINSYVKYPFTKEQIDKINQISNKRTRLFILTEQDAKYWSDGNFECPFRNYRIFTFVNNTLIEYPIPKTYLDVIVDNMKHISDKLTRQ